MCDQSCAVQYPTLLKTSLLRHHCGTRTGWRLLKTHYDCGLETEQRCIVDKKWVSKTLFRQKWVSDVGSEILLPGMYPVLPANTFRAEEDKNNRFQVSPKCSNQSVLNGQFMASTALGTCRHCTNACRNDDDDAKLRRFRQNRTNQAVWTCTAEPWLVTGENTVYCNRVRSIKKRGQIPHHCLTVGESTKGGKRPCCKAGTVQVEPVRRSSHRGDWMKCATS